MSSDSAGPAWRLKDLSPGDYAHLSELIDACLALSPEARTDWLSRLAGEDLRAAEILRRLFATSDVTGHGTLLETGEVLTRHLASLVNGADTLVGRRVGPYRVLSLLGQGGMGSVWLAERADGLFSRQVALKLVHPMLMGRQVTERFAREREILASLSHPNIARLFDAGFTDAGQPFLALQYVPGNPITDYCDQRHLGVHERLRLFLQVLSAVQYAHAHLIIHRDLKPANILVTEEGEVQLLDFGIAKLLTADDARETELTQLGGRALTPDYAAPEQITGGPITTAADIYALGVILFELVTGQRPYRLKRDSRGALEEAILAAEPTAPSHAALSEPAAKARGTIPRRLVKSLRGDFDTIATKALKKSPAERYATANAFGEDIARFLRGEVVLARRDSTAYRAIKFVRRHRVGFAAVCILMLTLAAGLAATTYEAGVASTQRDAAIQAQLRSLTQTARARLRDGDVPGALSIILEVLPHQGARRPYTPEALSVFQEARAADAQLLALTGHMDRLWSAAFSPDGRRVVTASDDKTARIWDGAMGRELARLSAHTDRLSSAAYSPDGRHIATASYDKTARIWDAPTGRQLLLLDGHSERVRSVAFSPDNRYVVTASNDKTARVWDAATGRQMVRLIGHADAVTSAVFSPDGRQIATSSYDKTARVWDVASGREVRSLGPHPDRVSSAAFSPDGRRIVTALFDGTARVWDIATGQQIMLLSGHAALVRSASYSPDGRRLVTAAEDKTARLWDASTGREAALLSGHTDLVEDATFSPDNRLVATVSTDKTARIWDVSTDPERVLLSGHSDRVNSAAFSRDGRHVVTASDDATARVWDSTTGTEILALRGHTGWVTTAAFSPDGQHIVTASIDKTARVWDVPTGRELTRLTGHGERVFSAAFSPDGRRVVTASLDKTGRIWDAGTGREMVVLRGHTNWLESAAFSPDGRRVVTASDDQTARVWDAATGREILVLSGHTSLLNTAAFSPDGRHVVTASSDKTVRIWDAATGRTVVMLTGNTEPMLSAAFSPDGCQVVTSSDDRTARIWDVATGRQLLLLRGHTDRVWSAQFSPDGRSVVTASDDKSARIWDARAVSLSTQIDAALAAQFDPLTDAERFQLGLPPLTGQHQWPADSSKCDESAAAPYDPDRRAAGAMLEHITTDIALEACAGAGTSGSAARSSYQRGRALMASGNFGAAGRELAEALAHGYRAAHVDLAMLLSQPSAGMLNVPKALSLYEQGWHDGVTIAAFDLGSLYEHGVRRGGDTNEYLLAPDNARAWTWYRKGADAGEPAALARFGEKADQAAFAESDPAKRKAHLLESFKYYTAAAERAAAEDWPEDAWRDWRYRRASLARMLARDGMMQEIADDYASIRGQYSLPDHSLWRRLLSLARLD